MTDAGADAGARTADGEAGVATQRLASFDAKNTLLVPVLAVVSALIVGAFIVGATDIERLKTATFGGIVTNIVGRVQGAVQRRVRQLVGHQRDASSSPRR